MLKNLEPRSNKKKGGVHECACLYMHSCSHFHPCPDMYSYSCSHIHPCPTFNHACMSEYSNAIQTPPPHGSCCRQIWSHESVRDMTCQRMGYTIDTDANPTLADAHECARPPESKNTDTVAGQDCVGTDVDQWYWIEIPASACSLRRFVPFCSRTR